MRGVFMNYRDRAKEWLESPFIDETTKCEIREMDDKTLEDSFFTELEFGTGGLRGVMGAGTNRMNIYTVRAATYGLAKDLIESGEDLSRGVVIAHDSRNNSPVFAREAAAVLSGCNIKAYLFESLRPTPELSFSVRHLGCVRGIVITASHNPKEYNGYKVYGEDGGQIPPDTAARILKEIRSVSPASDIPHRDGGYISVGKEIDDEYIKAIHAESFGEDIGDLRVIYTPLHGAGRMPVERILNTIGVKNLYTVEEQREPNGDFPTVKSPNPENKEAFDIAIAYAKEHPADVIIGTDPDSDRIGVVVPERDGSFTVLNGNQTGVLLCDYILTKTKENGMPTEGRVVKTIVTTEMVRAVADSYGVKTVDVLTGFKYIGDKIKEYEKGGETYLFGLEESYGYLRGTYARDKDAVVASMLICELAASLKKRGVTLSDRLNELYGIYGFHKERLISYTFKGIEGMERIASLMKKVREMPELDGETRRLDYLNGIDGLPRSDVMKYFLKDGWIAVRPSGTEPKIKFYIAAVAESAELCDAKLDAREKMLRDIVGE
jgi:phosphoglucomutase